jgi:lysyl-tRNA synthetase, class II
MADSTAQEVSDSVANLHLDDITGERVSKTELKKRQKLRAQEEKKQQRAAAAPPKAEKKRPAEEEEEATLTPNVSNLSSSFHVSC